MCLQRTMSDAEMRNILPKKKFYAYKIVRRGAGYLTSPMRAHTWLPGENVSNDTGRDSHAGFYVCLVKPGLSILLRDKNLACIEMEIDPEDVKAAGPDQINGHQCTCLIVRKLTVTQQAYDKAMDAKATRSLVRGLLRTAHKLVKENKSKLAKRKAVRKRTVRKATKKAVTLSQKLRKYRSIKARKKIMKMTDRELRTLAKEIELTGYSKLRKDSLCAEIIKTVTPIKKR